MSRIVHWKNYCVDHWGYQHLECPALQQRGDRYFWAVRFKPVLTGILVGAFLYFDAPLGLIGLGILTIVGEVAPSLGWIDQLYNRVLRHSFGAPFLPPDPKLRKIACIIGGGFIGGGGVALLLGSVPIALILEGTVLFDVASVITLGICPVSAGMFYGAKRTGDRAKDAAMRIQHLIALQQEAFQLVRARDEENVALTAAIEKLRMEFQPVVRWSDRSVFAYEALVRSEEPALPRTDLLLRAAERQGRMVELGRAIRRRVVAQAKEAPSDTILLVNIHPEELKDPDLVDPSSPLCQFASRVIIEITERASLSDVPQVAKTLEQLRALGFRVAVDDLGAGYSGLTALAELQPEVVKLDMALIRHVDEDRARQAVIESIYGLCKDLRILVIAEGVETEAECATILRLGGNLIQGYLFARPASGFRQPVWPPSSDDAAVPSRRGA